MRSSRINLCFAGLIAFLLGMPLAEKAIASSDGTGITGAAFDLLATIMQAVEGS